MLIGQHIKGLTVEEIDKLNARPSRPSPVSMLEAVSSSEEGHRNRQFKIKDNLDDGAMLEPLDSSSDESANDSFTCSEFEYENEKGSSPSGRDAMSLNTPTSFSKLGPQSVK
jgi:protocadherin Fat 4